MISIAKHLFFGFLLRLAFVAYGLYQDSVSVVKFTDIDYSVFTDAAHYVVNGSSPYLRETFRYTPILAWMLTPNITWFASYGKLLFVFFDLLTAYLIFLLLKNQRRYEGGSDSCTNWSLVWIYNPLPIVICTRGSSEAIILTLVLGTLYFCQLNVTGIGGFLYGFAVHFKPYTLPFCLPLYLATGPVGDEGFFKKFFTLNGTRMKLILGSILGFGIPTVISYQLYGEEFLEETYFYHVKRKDIRHNFSLYFYLLYLNSGNDGLLLKLISFVPQLILCVGAAVLFPKKTDLAFVLFVQTYCFVVFNKVCTSQYFLWYLSFLPVLAPKLSMKWTHGLILLAVWYFAQIAWLLPAYYLEFEGRNTFMYVWLESIAFFCANIGILVQIIKSYSKIE